jgi:hypothetical protein
VPEYGLAPVWTFNKLKERLRADTMLTTDTIDAPEAHENSLASSGSSLGLPIVPGTPSNVAAAVLSGKLALCDTVTVARGYLRTGNDARMVKGLSYVDRTWTQDRHHTQQASYNHFQLRHIPDLATFAALRRELRGYANHYLIQPAPKLAQLEGFATGSGYGTARNGATFEGSNRRYFTIDIDHFDGRNIDPDYSMLERQRSLANDVQAMLEYAFPDEEWLLCANVVAATSSRAGLGEPGKLKVQLTFRLAVPATLAQHKKIVAYLNQKAASRGCSGMLDASIYSVSSLLYTGKADTWEAGTGRELPHPWTAESVVLIPGSCDLSVPAHVFGASSALATPRERGAKPDGHAVRLTGWLSNEELLASLGPANYQTAIMTLQMRYAEEYPNDREAVRKHLRAVVVARIRETSEPERVDERIAAHTTAWFDEKWTGACTKKDASSRPEITAVAAKAITRPCKSDARATLKAWATEVVRRAFAGEPFQILIQADVGAGKTVALLGAVVAHPDWRKKRVVFLMPTHPLAKENVARLRAGLPKEDARLIRHRMGRAATGLCKSEEENTYEHRMATWVEKTLRQSPADPVCGKCQFRESCAVAGWLFMREESGPGIVFMAHAHMSSTLNKLEPDSEDGADLYIVDESAASTFVYCPTENTLPDGCKTKKMPLAALDLSGQWVRRRRNRKSTVAVAAKQAQLGNETPVNEAWNLTTADILHGATNDLHVGRNALLAVLSRGNMRVEFRDASELQRLTESGKTVAQMALAAEQEWQNFLLAELKTAVVVSHRIGEADSALHSSRLNKLKDLLHASHAAESILFEFVRSSRLGRPYLPATEVAHGSIHVESRLSVPQHMLAGSVVWLDATATEKTWRAMVLNAAGPVEVRTLRIELGAYYATQCLDKAFSRTGFVGTGNEVETARKKRSDSTLAQLHRLIWHRSACYSTRQHGCVIPAPKTEVATKFDVLVFVQKAVEEALLDMGMPSNVYLSHFGLERGLNAFEQIPCIIAAGRAAASPADHELLTEAWFAADPEFMGLAPASQFSKVTRRFEMANGEAAEVECEGYGDPWCDELFTASTGGGLAQAIGRGRAPNRTADNPLEVIALGQSKAGLPLHHIARWDELDVAPLQVALAQGVVPRGVEGARRQMVGVLSVGDHAKKAWCEALKAAQLLKGLYPHKKEREGLEGKKECHLIGLQPLKGQEPQFHEAQVSFELKNTRSVTYWLDATRFPTEDLAALHIQQLTGVKVRSFKWGTANVVVRLGYRALVFTPAEPVEHPLQKQADMVSV